MTFDQPLHCSHQMTTIILEGVQEIIGRTGLQEVAAVAGRHDPALPPLLDAFENGLSYGHFGLIQSVLDQIYGERAARGIALQSGRAAFRFLLKAYGVEAGFESLEFRLLAPRKRIFQGLRALAAIIGRECATSITVTDSGEYWEWTVEHCPECWGQQRPEPACHFTIGLLQELSSWISGGRVYLIREVSCRACGEPACILQVLQKPLD